MALAEGLFTVAGLPAHPLLVDAVAVLLPLAALCSVGLAVHRRLRRRFGWPVLALTAVAVGAVPLAQASGRQLLARVPADPLVRRHADLGAGLLPYALGFGVAVLVLVVAGKLADRERMASLRAEHGRAREQEALAPAPVAVAVAEDPGAVSRAWRRIAVLASVLVIGMAVVTTVEVVRISIAGATAVWHGVGR